MRRYAVASCLLTIPFSLMLALLLMSGQAWGARITVERIVAKVNDEIITLSEVQEEAKEELREIRENYEGEERRRRSREAELKALEKLIEKTLMLQRAEELELSVSDKELETAIELIKEQNELTDAAFKAALKREGIDYEEYREHIRRELLLGDVRRREVDSHVVVSGDEVVSFYRDNISRYMKDEERRARHIFFALGPGADRAEVERMMGKAEALAAKLRNGSNFGEIAREYSEGPAASKGGDLGYIKRGEVFPEFERVLFSLEHGQVGGPVRTRIGIHIIKLEEIKSGIPVPLEKVKDEIRVEILKRKREERRREWMAELKRKAFLEVTYDQEGETRGSPKLASADGESERRFPPRLTSRDGWKLVDTYALRKIQLLEGKDPLGKEQIYWSFGTRRGEPSWKAEPIRVNDLMAIDTAELDGVENRFKFFEEPDESLALFFYEEDTWRRDDYLGSLSFQEVIRAFKDDSSIKEQSFILGSKKLKVVIQVERRLIRRIVSGEGL